MSYQDIGECYNSADSIAYLSFLKQGHDNSICKHEQDTIFALGTEILGKQSESLFLESTDEHEGNDEGLGKEIKVEEAACNNARYRQHYHQPDEIGVCSSTEFILLQV